MKKVLFVCVENAGRSKMAEAFFKRYAQNKFEATSAGTNPSQKTNPVVVKAMSEIGIDIDHQTPQRLSDEMLSDSVVVNMGCMGQESCPALFVRDIINWNIPDPKGKSIDEIRIIRDTIDLNVKELIKQLED
ncbi:MAG: arsenate reductase ArsC [Nitrosarchaeum sp.]|nr:arsenate reductase ArsC [Nitrosarchaeum sp.]